jgi:hypothetical protein
MEAARSLSLEVNPVASFPPGLRCRGGCRQCNALPPVPSVTRSRLAALLCAAVSLPAFAHHGKDFLVVESYEVPHPGDAYALATTEYLRDGGAEESEIEPSVLFGIADGLAGEMHAHLAKAPGESFKYEAVAPALHWQLTGSDSDFPVRVGISAEYEIAKSAPDRAESRLVLEKGFDGSKLALNVLTSHEAGSATRYGYAAGYRYEFDERVALGLETQGFFDAPAACEALLGAYLEPVESFTIKLGLGTGIGSGAPDLTAHASVVLRF